MGVPTLTTVRRLATVAAAVAVVGASAWACDGGGSGGDERRAGVYVAVIRHLLTEGAPPDLREGEDLVVLVHPLDDAADIPLAVQADVLDVLDDLDEFAAVRFVDELADVVRADEPGQPVRGGAVAVGLGPVEERDGLVSVRTTRYAGEGMAAGTVYVAEESDGGWRVERTGTFEPELELD